MNRITMRVAVIACVVALGAAGLAVSKEFTFSIVTLENVSNFREDRIAYQHIQADSPKDGISENDPSIASLLIITGNKIYLLKDGFDDLQEVQGRRWYYDAEKRVVRDDKIWLNRIDGKPDYIRIADRKNTLMSKVDKTGPSGQGNEAKTGPDAGKTADAADGAFVAKNFQDMYAKTRMELIKKYVEIFRKMIINRKEGGVVVERREIPQRLYLGSVYQVPRYAIMISAETSDHKWYYAEDADGDGVTETLAVHSMDGFNWGYKSGPNVIFIYKNREKDIADLIGNLTKEAYYGTEEEAKAIKEDMRETFPEGNDSQRIRRWIDDLSPTE